MEIVHPRSDRSKLASAETIASSGCSTSAVPGIVRAAGEVIDGKLDDHFRWWSGRPASGTQPILNLQ